MYDNHPLVSVIVTTKNEEANIGNCLDSIRKQSYPEGKIEVIVVDNDSSDQTKKVARSYANLVFDKGPERSAQRNYGVEKSSGEYFIYLDADMVLSENVIEDCVNEITKDSEIIALYISEIVTGERFFSKVRRFERSFYDGTVVDCARFIRKEKFEKVGGFEEDLTGPEDWDLDKKLRSIGKINLIKTPIRHNEAEFDLRRYLDKKGYYAKKFDAYIAKWGKNDYDLRRQLGVYYRFLGIFIENGKWKKLVSHPILTGGMYFLRILVGIKFIIRQ